MLTLNACNLILKHIVLPASVLFRSLSCPLQLNRDYCAWGAHLKMPRCCSKTVEERALLWCFVEPCQRITYQIRSIHQLLLKEGFTKSGRSQFLLQNSLYCKELQQTCKEQKRLLLLILIYMIKKLTNHLLWPVMLKYALSTSEGFFKLFCKCLCAAGIELKLIWLIQNQLLTVLFRGL